MLPRVFIRMGVVIVLLALIPPLMILKARYAPSEEPRYHVIFDMDNQPKYRAQAESVMFADRRAMRPPVPGTVARGRLELDDHYYRGIGPEGTWAETFPEQVVLSMRTLERGRERYNIYCTPCHSPTGDGQGIVNLRAMRLMERGEALWVQPANLYAANVRARPVGHLFNTITNGYNTMPAYASQIPTADRWAIVAYVRALQLSRFADWELVPEGEAERLRAIEAEQIASLEAAAAEAEDAADTQEVQE